MSNRSNVVMFVYVFPPLGGSGVQRNLKFVKYLPEEGFDPIVIAGRPRWFTMRDESLLGDVPARARVVSAHTLPLLQAQWKLDGLLRRAGIESRVVRQALIPDSFVGWIPAAIWHALRAIRRGGVHVLYSSYPPASAHLAAMVVHRLTGIPWIADFRDACALDPLADDYTSYRAPARTLAALERRVTTTAEYSVVACDSIEFVGLPSEARQRVVIPNGLDVDDFVRAGAGQPRSDGRFRLAYVGSLYGRHNASPVFQAIASLIGSGSMDPDEFELRIVGNARPHDQQLRSVPLTFTGYVDHPRAVGEMQNADVLLFSLPPGYRGASSKVYEYLAAGRPILCVADADNVGSRLIRELKAGVCVEPGDVDGIGRALEKLYEDWRNGQLRVGPEVRTEAIRRYGRRKLTGDLAELFRTAIASERADRPPAGETRAASPAEPAGQRTSFLATNTAAHAERGPY